MQNDDIPSRFDCWDNQPQQEDHKWTSSAVSYVRYVTADLLICTWSSNCNNKQLWNLPHLWPWRDRATHQQQCARVQALLVLQRGSAATLVASTTSPSCTPPVARVGGRSFCEGGDYKYGSDGEIKGI